MVTIKCQRLNSDKQMEEVDIEIPSEIFININKSEGIEENHNEGIGFFDRFKNLFWSDLVMVKIMYEQLLNKDMNCIYWRIHI